MKYYIDIVIDGVRIASFNEENSISDIGTFLNDNVGNDLLDDVRLKLMYTDDVVIDVDDVIKPSKQSTESVNKKQTSEDFEGIPNPGEDLKNILIVKYGFKPEDIIAEPDDVVLFGNPEDWEIELSGDEDLDEIAQFVYEQAKAEGKIEEKLKKPTSENYTETAPGEYVFWSASDLLKDGEQIPLVKVKTDDNGELFVEPLSDSEFDKESAKIATNSIASSVKSGKSLKDILLRVDKSLNHSDPFFSVEFDRSIINSGEELMAAQALRTLRDDLKAVANGKYATEQTIVDKFKELTGVDYYTEKIVDDNITVKLPDENNKMVEHTFSGKDQYNNLLGLMLKNPKDKMNYIPPNENPYIQRLKDLAEDLIEKVNLKNDPDFYKKASNQ